MTRTRITFFIILGVALTIVAFSLALQLVTSALLVQFYIAATIFSVGVVALDFLGILGGEAEDGAGDGDADGFDGADSDLAADAVDADAHGVDIEDTDFDAGDTSHGHTMGHLHDIDKVRGSRVLNVLAYLRLTVYFSLGFGPTGWVALASGRSPLVSLGLGIIVGVIALFLASAFFRLQRSDTDSSLQPHELLRAPAVVTIPLSHETMGRVRVQLGMNVTERYALAAEPGHEYKRGDTVQITRVTDECVYVI
jgi:hypothetical protein